MASTRALLRLLRPISRYRALSCTTESLLFKKRLSSSTPPTTLSRPQLKRSSVNSSRKRFYSDTLNQDPEPPDYLSETELHIFHKLLKELGPSKLEVNSTSHPSSHILFTIPPSSSQSCIQAKQASKQASRFVFGR